MANLIITTSTNAFLVDLGVFAPLVGYKKATFQKRSISFQLMNDESFVRVENSQGESWSVSMQASGQSLIIDTIDGIIPTSNSDLFDILYSKL